VSDRSKHLEFLRATAREALWAADFDRALLLLEEGLALSRAWKQRESEEIFLCNRIATLIEMGRNDFDLSPLKEILLRQPSGPLGAFSAYVAGKAHFFRKEMGKARSYAQMAMSRCERRDDYLLGAAVNLAGNVSLAECDFDAAMRLTREAVSIFETCDRDTTRELAQAEDNMGYIYICRDQVPVGLPMVEHSLSQFEALGAKAYMTSPCLDMCLGHLKLESLDEAEQWGIRALALSQEFREPDDIKNSHYLLGEIYSELGRRDDADLHFEALAGYYPDFPALKSFLQQVNVVGMINLRA
jgi:tetratricopeptide (TPR) repeat protein